MLFRSPPGSLGGTDIPLAGAFVYGLCLYAVTVRCRPRVVAGAAAVTVVGAAFIDLGAIPLAVFLTAVAVLLGVVVRVRRSGARQLAEQERRHWCCPRTARGWRRRSRSAR